MVCRWPAFLQRGEMRKKTCYPGYYPERPPRDFHELLVHLATFDGSVIDNRENVVDGHREVQKHLIINPRLVIGEDRMYGKYREDLYLLENGMPSASDLVYLTRSKAAANGEFTLWIVEVKGIIGVSTRQNHRADGNIRRLQRLNGHWDAVRQLAAAARFYHSCGGRRRYLEEPYVPAVANGFRFLYRGNPGERRQVGNEYMHGPFDVTKDVRRELKANALMSRSSSP